MDQEYLLREGLALMVVGMSIVFSFLCLMVGVMSFSRFFQRFAYLLPDPQPAPVRSVARVAASADESARVAIAIAVARTR